MFSHHPSVSLTELPVGCGGGSHISTCLGTSVNHNTLDTEDRENLPKHENPVSFPTVDSSGQLIQASIYSLVVFWEQTQRQFWVLGKQVRCTHVFTKLMAQWRRQTVWHVWAWRKYWVLRKICRKHLTQLSRKSAADELKREWWVRVGQTNAPELGGDGGIVDGTDTVKRWEFLAE